VLCPEVLLVSSDFNFHLDDFSDANARKFMELMDMFGLLQHNTTPMLLENAKQRQISLKNVVATQENCFKLYDPCLKSLRKISSLPMMIPAS